MDEAALLLRIRVVIGSTRAAARSLRNDDGQLADALERGRRLLDELAPLVERAESEAVRDSFARANERLAELGRREPDR